jgi:hypothetical protein
MKQPKNYFNFNEVTASQIKSYLKINPLFKTIDDVSKHDVPFVAIAARFAYSSHNPVIRGLRGREIMPATGTTPRIVSYMLDDCMVLSIRGTETSTDVLRDAWVTPITCGSLGGARVHTGGFIHCMECLMMSMKTIVANPKKKLVLTGTSLGAAVAKMMARALILNDIVGADNVRVALFSKPSGSNGGVDVAVKGVSFLNVKDGLLRFSQTLYKSKDVNNVYESDITMKGRSHNTYHVKDTYLTSQPMTNLPKVNPFTAV